MRVDIYTPHSVGKVFKALIHFKIVKCKALTLKHLLQDHEHVMIDSKCVCHVYQIYEGVDKNEIMSSGIEQRKMRCG